MTGTRFKHYRSKYGFQITVHFFGHDWKFDIIPILSEFRSSEAKQYLGQKYSLTWLCFTIDYYDMMNEKKKIGL